MFPKLKFPSIATLLCLVFFAYVLVSIWNLAKLFQAPYCSNPKDCFHPIINDNPKYQLLAYSSIKKEIHALRDLTLLHQKSLFDYHKEQSFDIKASIPEVVRKNGSMALHIFITSNPLKPMNLRDIIENDLSVYSSIPLTEYETPQAKVFQLLGENQDVNKQSENMMQKDKKKILPVTHFRSKINFNILTDNIALPKDKIDYEVSRFLKVNGRGKYLPMLHIDKLSLRVKDLVEVGTTTPEVNLTINYAPMSFGKLRLGIQVEAALEQMKNLGFTSKDVDEVKGLFTSVNIYLLCGTFFVSALHMMFDFLAFKNDISFWRGLDNMGGISPSTVAWRAFAQIVVFLYLLEEQTSMLVLAPNAIGCFIELWKVSKTFHIQVVGWKLQFGRKPTKEESATQALDNEGFKYLTYVIYPLCAIGAVYSLLYTPHKSWYSWIVQSLVNGVYAFGFLFMLPQLFINYRLKSVAHLPWRAFMYKAFNTFIDDIFAFIITMPTAHRVACFRDDIVFVVYLYQKWLYPVDKTRTNEYGQKGEEHPKEE